MQPSSALPQPLGLGARPAGGLCGSGARPPLLPWLGGWARTHRGRAACPFQCDTGQRQRSQERPGRLQKSWR